MLDEISDTRGPVTHVIVGGASGADYWAEAWAFMRFGEKGFTRMPIKKSDWKALGKKAGPLRNRKMIDEKPDLVVAFPGGFGTADCVRQAKAAGIEVVEATSIAARWRDAVEQDEADP